MNGLTQARDTSYNIHLTQKSDTLDIKPIYGTIQYSLERNLAQLEDTS